jgi:glycosyltransferase involved in cell wall biosynthesis
MDVNGVAMKRRILFVVNDPAFFVSHRMAIALKVRAMGWDTHVATKPGIAVEEITAQGLTHHPLPLDRSGRNPLKEWVLFWAILRLFRSLKPDLVHLVTIKPVLYGGIAARIARVPSVVVAVSGLGFIFMAQGARARLARWLVTSLYRLALGKRNLAAIFQNTDDRDTLIAAGALSCDKACIIRGSGVDLSLYRAREEPSGDTFIVAMAARLLNDKGVREFVRAAEIIEQRKLPVRFRLIGDIDPGNPTSVSQQELDAWRQAGTVELMGYRRDIADIFADSNIVVLPSYREGLPKVLVEAAACGRAVVTTDVPGCRDAIEPDVTGLLVPVQDAVALADAIERLIKDDDLRKQFARQGTALAQREFGIDKIVDAHLQIYRRLESEA